MRRRGTFLLLAAITGAAGAASLSAETVRGHLRFRGEGPHRLLVKLDPAAGAHLRADGSLEVSRAADRLRLEGLERRFGLGFEPAVGMPTERIAALERRAIGLAEMRGRRISPRALGLAGALWVDLPTGGRDELLEVARALERLAAVQYVELVPTGRPAPPGGIALPPPATPDLVPLQGYLDEDPGLDIRFAWSLGIHGEGVRAADVEYDWDASHEELASQSFFLLPGATPTNANDFFTHHGTAVVGILDAADNGFGITGMVHGLDEVIAVSEETVEYGADRPTAILTAAEELAEGDLLILEMQTVAGAPAETVAAVWDATRLAVDMGLVVVAAAGNGNQDLDGEAYATYRDWGDSGAIIVGGGAPNIEHNKLSFSTHGERVDLQGWGEGVATAGGKTSLLDDEIVVDGDPARAYTVFDGTSAATPLVAAVAAAVQSYAQQEHGLTLSSEAMRDLLVASGIPQGQGEPIGPLPDTEVAIHLLDASLDPLTPIAAFRADSRFLLPGGRVQLTDDSLNTLLFSDWQWSFPGGDPASHDGPDPPPVVYDLPGQYDVTLTVSSGPLGSDTLTRTDFLEVGTTIAMPNGLVRACSGDFFDTGVEEDHGAAQDRILILAPDPPDLNVRVSVDAFETQHGLFCENARSRLEIYDGTGTAAPQVLVLCSEQEPFSVVATNPEGTLTFRFKSELFETWPGWEGSVDCVALPDAYCDAAAESSDRGWIRAVHIGGGISHLSGAADGGYSDFSNPIFELRPENLVNGTHANLFLETGYLDDAQPFAHYWKVWIDLDKDGLFEEPEELWYDSILPWTFSNPADELVAVPPEAEGVTRVRVAMRNGSPPSPCESFPFGEVEDYTIDFTPVNGAPPLPPGPGELEAGVPLRGLAGAAGDERRFFLDAPGDAHLLLLATRGGRGDVDLFLRREALPSRRDHDCASTRRGTTEICPVLRPAAGRWYVMLRGKRAFRGVRLEALVR